MKIEKPIWDYKGLTIRHRAFCRFCRHNQWIPEVTCLMHRRSQNWISKLHLAIGKVNPLNRGLHWYRRSVPQSKARSTRTLLEDPETAADFIFSIDLTIVSYSLMYRSHCWYKELDNQEKNPPMSLRHSKKGPFSIGVLLVYHSIIGKWSRASPEGNRQLLTFL